MRDLSQIVVIAAKDLFNEYLMAIWTILGIAAVVTPLLVMFGLKNGIVASMQGLLIESAIYRELRPTEFRSYTKEWLDTLQARPEVSFVIPDTRLLFSPIDLINPDDPGVASQTGTMRPTMVGDPFLEEWNKRVVDDFDVVLSRRLAMALQVDEGARLIGMLSRRRDTESVEVALNVTGVLPAEAPNSLKRNFIFVSLPLLVGAERYREEEHVTGLTDPGKLPDPDTQPWVYGSFRAFARSIEDVLPLVDWLDSQDIEVDSQYQRIAEITQLDKALTLVFVILAGVAIIGGATSMGASVYGGVLRKSHELSLLRLIGFSTHAIVLFPVIQSGLLSMLGAAAAIGSYFLVEPIVNSQLGPVAQGLFSGRLDANEPLSLLLPQHFVVAIGSVFVVSIATAAVGAWRAGRITPARGLRRE